MEEWRLKILGAKNLWHHEKTEKNPAEKKPGKNAVQVIGELIHPPIPSIIITLNHATKKEEI